MMLSGAADLAAPLSRQPTLAGEKMSAPD